MNKIVKGAALAGFVARIASMVAVYGGIEREPVASQADRAAGLGAPEWWESGHDEQMNATATSYITPYGDCTLHMSKDSTGAWTTLVMAILECPRGPDSVNRDYDDGPDYAAVWPDQENCSVSAVEVKEPDGGGVGHLAVHIGCWGWDSAGP